MKGEAVLSILDWSGEIFSFSPSPPIRNNRDKVS
jgi:hypothetical protein